MVPPTGAIELAAVADRARAVGDGDAGRLRLEVLRLLLETWRDVEPRLRDADPTDARLLQDWQDDVRELLIDPDRWPVRDAVAGLVTALEPYRGPA